jgi:hypothetical protein
LPGSGDAKTTVLPSKTSATQNGRSPTNAPQFPKTCTTHLRRNRQNRCRCQPACLKRLRQPCRAIAKQKRPLPTKTCAAAQTPTNQPASTFRRLVKAATRRKMTQTSWFNRVGVCFPKLTLCQNAQKESWPSLTMPFAVFQSLEALSPREPTRILETNRNPNLKKWPQ